MSGNKHFSVISSLKGIVIILFSFFSLVSVHAEGLRNISVITHNYYFDDTWALTIEDVFLARISPKITIQAKVARSETESRYVYIFSAGPVIGFTDSLYTDILYGLGIDSNSQIEHRWNANLNFETDKTLLQFGFRGAYVPETEYLYIIPAVGGKFMLTNWLGFLNKIFLSWDNNEVFSGSYWGELEWVVSGKMTLRSGGTVTLSESPGFSLIAGINVRFSPKALLKYHFKYMSDSVSSTGAVERKDGIENSLYFDIRF